MFGGVGLYAGDLFFALIAGDVLYLKADKATHDGEGGRAPVSAGPRLAEGQGQDAVLQRPGRDPQDAEALLA
jgi:hypothetical protein